MQVPQDILCILERCRVEGNTIFLPEQLDRNVYVQVNKCLENIGGKWERKVKGHVYDHDPTDAFENLLLTGETEDMKKVFQFFPTPKDVAEKLCDLAELVDGSRVLEPSVGKGNLADVIWARGCVGNDKECNGAQVSNMTIHGIELNKDMERYLDGKPYMAITGQDFLEWAPAQLNSSFIPYTHVIMNPPFARQQYIDHIIAAFDLLAPGGILVSVASTSWQWRDNSKSRTFREWLYENEAVKGVEVIKLPEGTFKESGTMMPSVIIKLRRNGILQTAIPQANELKPLVSKPKPTNGGLNMHENGICMKDEAIKKISDSKGDTKHDFVSFLISPIAEYLLDRLNDGNEELAAQVNSEHKTLQKCIDFVAEQCQKQLDGKPGQIADAEVYQMAMDYFAIDDAELERQKAEAEVKRQEQRKEQEAANQRLMEERKAKAEADKAEKAAQKKVEATKKAAEKKQAEGQLSLFGFDDEESTQEEAEAA